MSEPSDPPTPMRSPNGTSRAPWWRRVTLRDVMFATLPPLALAVWLLGSAMLDYHRIRQFDDWWSNATSVRKFAWYRLRSLARAPELATLRHRLSPEREDWPSLRLLVDKRDFERIDSDVGGHWGEWIDARVIGGGGDLQRAEMRWRGDGSAHWTSEKKSFTLKAKNDELVRGFGTLAFSAKDVLPQWLVGTIAKDFGLLAPEQQIVPVFVNERFYGLHRFVEPIDESFLRRNLRMPGNVFRADTAERGDYFKGTQREVFLNPFIWDRAAKNDRPGAAGTASLALFLADLNTSTFEEHERFMAWLDRDELSRLLAFLLVAGDPYHMSGVHNQYWYEDPTSGKFHPVVWDVRLLDLASPPRDSNVNRFWRAALRDPRVWDGAMREVLERLDGDELYRAAEERVNEAWARYRDAFEYDSLRAGLVMPVGSPEETLATLRKNLDTLRKWTDDAKVRASCTLVAADPTYVLDVLVEGRASCRLKSVFADMEFEQLDFASMRLIADSNLDGVLGDGDREVPVVDRFGDVQAIYPERTFLLMPGCGATAATLAPEPRHYRLFVVFRDLPPGATVKGVQVAFENALTGKPLENVPRATDAIDVRSGAWHPWRYVEPAPARAYLSDEVRLTEDVVVGPQGSLDVAPGTKLWLDPGVSILVRGRATFRGTEGEPITIQRSNPDLPWGVIALQGEGASESRFEHVKFLGGGGGLLERVEYKGAVCVHNARDVVFDHCEFAENAGCDDLLNVVKGSADVLDCHFHDANADSIDYDMSSGTVARNLIERSGNDGLDLMTCWPRVIENTIRGSGDKGISIGEDSAPLVFNTTIEHCARGIEVKDRSEPVILHSHVHDCDLGIYAHLKNWRYGEAGWPKLVRSVLAANTVDLDDASKIVYVAENDARMTIHDSILEPQCEIQFDPDGIAWLTSMLGIRAMPDPDFVDPVPSHGPIEHWELVEPSAPVAEGTFAEDFVAPADGWWREAGVRRLFKRDGELVASLGLDPGRFGTSVDWDLSDGAKRHVLVLEIAGEGVEDLEAIVSASDADVRAPVELLTAPTSIPRANVQLSPGSLTYRYATVELPPRLYTSLALSAKPTDARARVYVHGYRVFALPAPGER